jgi:hypothetical protein
MLPLQQVTNFLQAALESTIYLSPNDPGLTNAELVECGKQAGFRLGEISDALPQITVQYIGGSAARRNLPNASTMTWNITAIPQNPEYRNFQALDFVMHELNERTREFGAGAAQIERDVLVQRGVDAGISRLDMEASVTLLVLADQLVEKDGRVRFKSQMVHTPLPSKQLNGIGLTRHSETRAKAYAIVQDVIARRTDSRPAESEPLDAFASVLENLGYKPFRMWWTQTVSEFRRADSLSSPVSVLVLAAALVEASLTFVVKYARDRQLGPFQSSDFDREPRTWKIEDLVNSAATGRDAAILDPASKARADNLIRNRQRIHAGRMLSEFPKGVPDLKPEEARDAKATAELVTRKVLDWLQANP